MNYGWKHFFVDTSLDIALAMLTAYLLHEFFQLLQFNVFSQGPSYFLAILLPCVIWYAVVRAVLRIAYGTAQAGSLMKKPDIARTLAVLRSLCTGYSRAAILAVTMCSALALSLFVMPWMSDVIVAQYALPAAVPFSLTLAFALTAWGIWKEQSQAS